jgi:hypothetical protein
LREWKGLSYREVAAEMGLSQGAVETLIFRARRSLAAALDQPRTPTDRARLAHAFDGGALLASLKAALSGSLSGSLATGLAVAASATAIATGPVGHVDWIRPTAQNPAAKVAHTPATPTVRTAPADRDPSSVARANAGHGNGKGHVKSGPVGKAHRKSAHGGSKPAWGGRGGSSQHSHAGGNGKSNARG